MRERAASALVESGWRELGPRCRGEAAACTWRLFVSTFDTAAPPSQACIYVLCSVGRSVGQPASGAIVPSHRFICIRNSRRIINTANGKGARTEEGAKSAGSLTATCQNGARSALPHITSRVPSNTNAVTCELLRIHIYRVAELPLKSTLTGGVDGRRWTDYQTRGQWPYRTSVGGQI